MARLNASLRSQEKETEKWKADAERSIAKEKDTRRAMESAKVAAANVLRRCFMRRSMLCCWLCKVLMFFVIFTVLTSSKHAHMF